tara:strand:+ start:22549 stop:24459 length:1911 start_codon:yes stop_codon:yes gene_type:complete
MFGKNTPRLLIIAVILLWAVYALYPTIQYESLSSEEVDAMAEDGSLQVLEKQIIHRGLDLQGGMHVVLEVDIPKLIEKIAVSKTDKFYQVLQTAQDKTTGLESNFIEIFIQEADEQGLKLNRHYSGFGSSSQGILNRLQNEADDAINRALEILQNRVDQFGVSEPTIQKQGNQRIIVELAGVQDPDRARALLESTALLEFILLKDPQVTQDLLERIDKVVKGNEDIQDLIAETSDAIETEEDTTETEERLVEEKEVSLVELFSEEDDTAGSDEDTSSILVDEVLFEDRPFSSLLRNIGGDLGVPFQNKFAVEKILELEEVKTLIAAEESRISWQAHVETFTSSEGFDESFYRLFHLEKEAGLSGGVITEAQEDFYNAQPIVTLNMNSEGAKTWSRLTGSNIGKRLAIVLDNKVHMTPSVRNKINNGRTQVEGFADMSEAKDIAIVLRAGALPAPINIIEERTVGPSLGQDSIEKGTQSIIWGLLTILGFMLIYYKFSGAIADFALIWNLVIVLSVLAMLDATLTLPGIAGLILTVGMCVDANVIIFERIREELGKGKTVRAAIDSGYARALTTIIDANVTTILAALILMQFGTGPIKGFAIVLFWGIASSMFTAIFITRTIFNLITSRKSLQTLSI